MSSLEYGILTFGTLLLFIGFVIDVIDNNASALSIDASGKAGILNIISRGSVGFVPTTTGPIGGAVTSRVHLQGAEPGFILSSDIHPVTGIQTNTQAYQLGLAIGYSNVNDIRNHIYFGNAPLTFTYSANQGVAIAERMKKLDREVNSIGRDFIVRMVKKQLGNTYTEDNIYKAIKDSKSNHCSWVFVVTFNF